MYDVCTNETFNNFVEACIREIICNFPVEDDIFRKYTTPILSELVYFKWISNNPGKKLLPNDINRINATIPIIKTI